MINKILLFANTLSPDGAVGINKTQPCLQYIPQPHEPTQNPSCEKNCKQQHNYITVKITK